MNDGTIYYSVRLMKNRVLLPGHSTLPLPSAVYFTQGSLRIACTPSKLAGKHLRTLVFSVLSLLLCVHGHNFVVKYRDTLV